MNLNQNKFDIEKVEKSMFIESFEMNKNRFIKYV